MNALKQIDLLLLDAAKSHPKNHTAYKMGTGDYAEHEQFLGVNAPSLQIIAKKFSRLSLSDLLILLQSPFHEKRALALRILTLQYPKADAENQEKIFSFYMDNLKHVNNWSLVDISAHRIVGAHLLKADKKQLLKLAQSKVMWERRIAIVATWWFIRNQDLEWTFTIAKILLNDSHDLIHKAVGWMLREAGKKDLEKLVGFLDQHAACMPRTMLRYSIERLPEWQRKQYMAFGHS